MLAIRLAIRCAEDGRTRPHTPDASTVVTCDNVRAPSSSWASNETLRLNGHASLTTDPAVLDLADRERMWEPGG
jgi:hypothetical protein